MVKYLHRGISHQTSSVVVGLLADDVVVNDAKMANGMLSDTSRARVVPDEKKPRLQ